MSSLVYASFAAGLPTGQIKVGISQFKMMLVGAAYMPDRVEHTRRNNVSDEIAASGGYIGGGLAIGSSSSYDPSTNRTGIEFSGLSLPNSTITAAAGVIYQVETGPETDILICYVNFAGIRITDNSTFTVTQSYVYLQF